MLDCLTLQDRTFGYAVLINRRELLLLENDCDYRLAQEFPSQADLERQAFPASARSVFSVRTDENRIRVGWCGCGIYEALMVGG